MHTIKSALREWLIALSLDISKNIRYDRLSRKILKNYLSPNSNCIDVGANKGEFTKCFLKYAPKGHHLAFEPLPHLYSYLSKFYPQIDVHDFALSDVAGVAEFHHITNAEEYSGLKIREYRVLDPIIKQLSIKTARLDDFVSFPIDLIKIDVEGAEYLVLKGSTETLQKYGPLLIFEFGIGASDYYGTDPLELYNFLVAEHGYHIFTLSDFLKNRDALKIEQFKSYYDSNSEYYFVARKH